MKIINTVHVFAPITLRASRPISPRTRRDKRLSPRSGKFGRDPGANRGLRKKLTKSNLGILACPLDNLDFNLT